MTNLAWPGRGRPRITDRPGYPCRSGRDYCEAMGGRYVPMPFWNSAEDGRLASFPAPVQPWLHESMGVENGTGDPWVLA